MEAKVCFHCFNPQNPWKYYLNIFGFWINLILCLITTSASYYAMKNIIASKKEGITAVEAVKKAEESLKSASQADATAMKRLSARSPRLTTLNSQQAG